MKTYAIILLLTLSQTSIAIVPQPALKDMFQPFKDTISFLEKSKWIYPKDTKKVFVENVTDAWNRLMQKKVDWVELLDPEQDPMQLQVPRSKFENKNYISKVFTTKPGTLVFQMKNYPDIIIKIDKRPAESLGLKNRSYFAAFTKTQEVQNEILLKNLYLPLEAAAISNEDINNEDTIKAVFSEKIPLFSTAELDHRILLHLLLESAEINDALMNNLKLVYKQMIHYICKVNFDDINYTNLPFARDGRLAPFDTDSQTADTGVERFLRLYFGYKILSLEEVMTAVNRSCGAPNIPLEERIQELYNDHSTEDSFFANNKAFIEGATNFILFKNATFRDQFNFATIIHGKNREHAKLLDKMVSEKLKIKSSLTVFGLRCENITEFTFKAATQIHAKSPQIAIHEGEDVVREILNKAKKEFSSVYSATDEPIDYRLGNFRDLRSFICF